MKKFFMLCAAALMMGCMTSCFDNGPIDNTYTTQDYYTFTGNLEEGYTLYSDHSTFIKVDQSVFDPGKSFGKTERGIVIAQYKESNIVDEGRGLKNPVIVGYVDIPTTNPMMLEEAESRKVLDADSCSILNKVECNAYRGYLTVLATANVGKTAPVMNLVYDPAEVKTDSITFTLCYNIHKQTVTNYNVSYHTCFRLDAIANIVPGSKDVVMTIKSKDSQPLIVKVARKNLRKGNWLSD